VRFSRALQLLDEPFFRQFLDTAATAANRNNRGDTRMVTV
jgi:hypothetical protein